MRVASQQRCVYLFPNTAVAMDIAKRCSRCLSDAEEAEKAHVRFLLPFQQPAFQIITKPQ